MAIILKASNANLIKNAKYSYLSTNYASGVLTIVVVNSSGFADDDYLLLGEMGQEKSEIVQIDTGGVNTTTHTLTLKVATKFAHSESSKVTILPYNQVKFYQTAAAVFSSSENYLGVVNVQPDSLYTIYQDSVNSTGFGWFKFYNETNLKITTNSNYIPYTDFAANTAKKIIDSFLKSLNQKESKLISPQDAFRWLSEAYSIAQTELNLVNREYKATISTEQDTVSGTAEYDFPINASEMNSIWDNTNKRELEECELKDVNEYNNVSSNVTKYYIRGNNLGFTPTPNSVVTYKLTYISKSVAITSLTDTIDLPDNKFYILEDFMRFRAAEPLGKANGQMYYELFFRAIEQMKTSAIKRGSGLKSIGIVHSANI